MFLKVVPETQVNNFVWPSLTMIPSGIIRFKCYFVTFVIMDCSAECLHFRQNICKIRLEYFVHALPLQFGYSWLTRVFFTNIEETFVFPANQTKVSVGFVEKYHQIMMGSICTRSEFHFIKIHLSICHREYNGY